MFGSDGCFPEDIQLNYLQDVTKTLNIHLPDLPFFHQRNICGGILSSAVNESVQGDTIYMKELPSFFGNSKETAFISLSENRNHYSLWLKE